MSFFAIIFQQETETEVKPTEMIDVKNTVTIKLEDIIERACPTPIPTPTKRSRENSFEQIGETSMSSFGRLSRKRRISSRASIASDIEPTKRPRGRPPKTEPTVISPTVRKELDPEKLRYLESRLKNNEASRRSRLNRKGKESKIFDELKYQEDRHQKLTLIDADLDRQVDNWKKKVLRLAVL